MKDGFPTAEFSVGHQMVSQLVFIELFGLLFVLEPVSEELLQVAAQFGALDGDEHHIGLRLVGGCFLETIFSPGAAF